MVRSVIHSPESSAEWTSAAAADDENSGLIRELDRTAGWGLWALPVWTVLLFMGTMDHQPDVRTDFAGFANYVTTTQFLISHIVASIVGAAFGVLGLLALFTFLALRVRSRLAAVGLVMAVVGNVLLTAIFGMAAFGQPAIGRLYQAGQSEAAIATYQDMYGASLASTAAAGILLLVIGVVALAIAITRSRVLPTVLLRKRHALHVSSRTATADVQVAIYLSRLNTWRQPLRRRETPRSGCQRLAGWTRAE
jgi:hypothetical protein